MGKQKRKTFSDEIRDLVEASGFSRYAICKGTGLDNGAMSHFLAGHRGLSLDSLDLLAGFLDLHVVAAKAKRGRRS
jgi:transcriptional regulator with XRE-family HTH domain